MTLEERTEKVFVDVVNEIFNNDTDKTIGQMRGEFKSLFASAILAAVRQEQEECAKTAERCNSGFGAANYIRQRNPTTEQEAASDVTL